MWKMTFSQACVIVLLTYNIITSHNLLSTISEIVDFVFGLVLVYDCIRIPYHLVVDIFMSLVKYYETQIWTSVTKLTKLPYGKIIMFFSGTQQGVPYCLRKPLTHNCWDPYVIPNSGASVLALRSLEHSWQCWQVGSLWGIMSLSLPWWFLMADSRARRVDVWEMHEHADNPLSGRWGEAACKSTCVRASPHQCRLGVSCQSH